MTGTWAPLIDFYGVLIICILVKNHLSRLLTLLCIQLHSVAKTKPVVVVTISPHVVVIHIQLMTTGLCLEICIVRLHAEIPGTMNSPKALIKHYILRKVWIQDPLVKDTCPCTGWTLSKIWIAMDIATMETILS